MSVNVGVRWQQEMEDHLSQVRECNTVLRAGMIPVENRQVYATQAQANATAALALALANTGGDIEVALSKLGGS